MSEITTKIVEKRKNFADEVIPLCWNKIQNLSAKRTEVIDSSDAIYQSGTDGRLAREITQTIDNADDVICVSSYVIQPSMITNALLKAAKRGVRVYLLTASEKHLEKEDFEMTPFDRKVIPEHKELLQIFAGKILVRTADHFHSKFILVDPNTKNAHGFILTANLTLGALYEDIIIDGEAVGTNFELGMALSSNQISEVYQQFLCGFWNEAKHELLEPEKLVGIGKATIQIEPQAQSVIWTVGEQRTLKDALMRLIDDAKSTLVLSAWSFDHDHESTKKILEKAISGVKVTILTRNRRMDVLKDLVLLDAQISGHERLHGKFIIADGSKGIMMTANFTSLGLDSGFETGIHLSPRQIEKLLVVHQEWASICRWRLMRDVLYKDINEKALVWNENELVEKTVKKEYLFSDTVQCKSMDEYVNPNIALSDPPLDALYLESIYSISLIPPRLPKKARLLLEETLSRKEKKNEALLEAVREYPLYRYQNRILIEVKDDKELPKALKLEKEHGWLVVVDLQERNINDI